MIGVMGLLGLVAGGSGRAADAEPQDLLEQAYRLDAGEGVTRDQAAAARLYAEAAAAGDAFAHLRLGSMCETGEGVPQDYAAARTHYQAAVDAGLPEARLRLAICDLEGWGGPVDRDAFVREVRMTAEGGYAPAQWIMAGICFHGFGMPVDKEAGVAWLEKAAKQNDALAQYSLGLRVEKLQRLNHTADLELARTWYQLSAEQEYLTSMRAMARGFMTEDRSNRDWQLARQWLELADESGDAEAPYILAVMSLVHVDATAEEAAKATPLLARAAERGNYRATELLEQAKAGQTLYDAAMYMLRTPQEERYVQNYRRKHGQDVSAPNAGPLPYRMITPVYPMGLRIAGVEGQALIEFVVDVTGRVQNAHVVKTDHPEFGERAAAATREWRFEPGRRDGRLANYRMRVPVFFQLSSEELLGADELFYFVKDRARQLGSQAEVDARELRWAELQRPVPLISLPDGSRPPPDARAILLLVIDQAGNAQRGYVIDARPKAVGEVALEVALNQQYRPRMLDGEAVPSSVVFIIGDQSQNPWLKTR